MSQIKQREGKTNENLCWVFLSIDVIINRNEIRNNEMKLLELYWF